MSVRTRPRALAAALLAAALLPLALPAAADTGPVGVGTSTLGDLVLDEARGRLFLSGGPRGTGVRVTDLRGTAVATVDGLPGATGMALAPDGSTLWVAVPTQGLVDVDPATLAVRRTVRLPEGHCAGDVAVSGGRLVYGYSCHRYVGTGGYGGVGVVDAATGASHGSDTTGPFYEPRVATGPAGSVYAADAGLSPSTLYLYDVRGTAPVPLHRRDQVCSYLEDLTASPDGSRVVTACGTPYRHEAYLAQGLVPGDTYASGPYPLAGAWSADGRTFAAGLRSAYEPDVYVHRAGLDTPVRVVDLGGTSDLLVPRGLAVSADGSRVWAVAQSASGGLTLRVLDVPGATSSTVVLDASPAPLYAGGTTTLSGRVTGVDGLPVAGAQLAVSRQGTGESPAPLAPVTTSEDGSFRFPDVPPRPQTYLYAVALPDGGRAEEAVLVWSTEPRLSVKASPSGTGVGGSVQLTYDGPTSPVGRTVGLRRTGGGTAVDLPPLTIGSGWTTPFTDSPGPGTWTYTATVAADGVHPGATATATVTVGEPTVLTAAGPSTADAGTPVPLTGRLATAAGAPLEDVQLAVVRSGCTTQGWRGTATTTADGTWALTDPAAPAGSCAYTVTYTGSSAYAPSIARVAVRVALQPTAMETSVTTGTPLAGAPLTVRGVLSSGGSGLADAPVRVERSGCGTTWRADALTAPDGSWSATDPAASAGSCTYTASWLGSPTHAPASRSVAVTVALRTPTLSISVVKGTGSTKKLVHVTGTLGATHTNRLLTITAQPVGGVESFVASGTVDANGRFTASHQPRTTTTYRVRFDGDAWYRAAVAERTQ